MWTLKSDDYYAVSFEFEYLEDACNFIRKYQESRRGYGEVEFKLKKVSNEKYIEQESESVRDTY